MDFTTLIGVSLLFLCALSGARYVLILSIASMCFSALVVLPPIILAGISLILTSASFAVFSVIVIFNTNREILIDALINPNKLGFLTAYVFWSLISTIFLPSLFEGKILVYPLSTDNGLFVLTPLRYSTSNVTQSMYILLSYLITVSIFTISYEKNFIRSLRIGVYLLCLGLIATGALDLIGLNDFLSYFRNANYSLVGDTEIASAKRIVGATPEASNYGFISSSVLSMLVFMPALFKRNMLWLITSLLIMVFSVLSASSTAYGMLGCTGVLFVFLQLGKLVVGGREVSIQAAVNISFLLIMAIAISVFIIIYPDISAQFSRLLDQLVFGKSLSSSYEERGRWTAAALNSLSLSSYLGIGMGSARTSNTFVNIMSGGGIIGSILFLCFVIKIYFSRIGFLGALTEIGPQISLIPIFFGLALAGPTPDYGSFVAILFGIQIGINSKAINLQLR